MTAKPVLYVALFSPPARACIFTALVIDLDVELKYVDFAKKEHLSDEFVNLNPQHQIPVLVDIDGEVYVDSHAIMCFLVSKYAKNDSLYPKDLTKRARVDSRLHFENGVLFQVIKDMVARNIYGGEYEFHSRTLEMCHNAYGFMEQFLKKNDFFACEHLTIADISIFTTLLTLNMLIPLDANLFPRVVNWLENMKECLPASEDLNVKGPQALVNRINSCMAEHKANAKV